MESEVGSHSFYSHILAVTFLSLLFELDPASLGGNVRHRDSCSTIDIQLTTARIKHAKRPEPPLPHATSLHNSTLLSSVSLIL
jgi:hypothetical protein